MVNRSRYSIIILFFMGVAISSCAPGQGGPPTVVSPVPSTIEPTRTLLSPTLTVMPATTTQAITKTPPSVQMGYAALPDGEYILYWSQARLWALSILNKSKTDILLVNGTRLQLSQDMKQIIDIPDTLRNSRVIDLETMEEEKLPYLDGCWDVFLLKDERTFLASCNGPKNFMEIYKYMLDDNQRTQLTDCAYEDAGCGRVVISPDGKWVSYLWGPDGIGQSSKTGFYITKSGCADQEYSCDDLAIGPYSLELDYVWAPNSKYLASSGITPIRLYEVKDSEIAMIRELQGTPARYSYYSLIWSPDSSQIAYTTGKEIWLVNISGETPMLFEQFDNNVNLIGWVTIKDGKVSP